MSRPDAIAGLSGGAGGARPSGPTLSSRFRNAARSRVYFAELRSWLWWCYHRAMTGAIKWLPGRGRLVALRARGWSRPLYLRLGTSDIPVLESVIMSGEYKDLGSVDFGPVGLVVDLGSNVGITIRYWKELFPGARVIGVEPDPGNMGICQRNAGAFPGVSLVQACVSDTEGTVHFDRTGEEWGYRMVGERGPGTVEVRAMPLSQILADNSLSGATIDLLKCDIEGAEERLFGSKPEWLLRTRHLIVELHAPYMRREFLADIERAGVSFAIRTLLESNGHVEVLLLSRQEDRA